MEDKIKGNIKEEIFSFITLNKSTVKLYASTVAKGCPNIVQHKNAVIASATRSTKVFFLLKKLFKYNLSDIMILYYYFKLSIIIAHENNFKFLS